MQPTWPYDSFWDQQLQRDYKAGKRGLNANRVDQEVQPPAPSDFVVLPRGTEYKKASAVGVDLLKKGKLGVLHLNGGLGTRFGQIKGTHDVLEIGGRMRTFLELKIAHVLWACKTYGGKILYGLMNSPMTDPVTQEFLNKNELFGLDQHRKVSFVQSVLRRKVPRAEDVSEYEIMHPTSPPPRPSPVKGEGASDVLSPPPLRGRVRVGGDGGDFIEPPQWAPAGHFDAVALLVQSRSLLKFLDAGVEYLQISNIDNLAATVEPAILGMLAEGRQDLLVEVALKKSGDRGGIPVLLDSKGVVLMEEFALPVGFDATKVGQFNTATYWIKVSRILKIFELSAKDLKEQSDAILSERVRRVREKIPVYVILKESQGSWVVQHEQLLGDLTRLYLQDTGKSATYLLIDTDKRFIPIKTKEDLQKEESRIRAVLEDRICLYG